MSRILYGTAESRIFRVGDFWVCRIKTTSTAVSHSLYSARKCRCDRYCGASEYSLNVTVSDALDSDHLPILFHILDHVSARDISAPGNWLRAGRSNDRGSIPGGGWEFFSSIPRPDRLWGPLSLLSNGYRRIIPWG